jgi:hypothetical protein
MTQPIMNNMKDVTAEDDDEKVKVRTSDSVLELMDDATFVKMEELEEEEGEKKKLKLEVEEKEEATPEDEEDWAGQTHL